MGEDCRNKVGNNYFSPSLAEYQGRDLQIERRNFKSKKEGEVSRCPSR